MTNRSKVCWSVVITVGMLLFSYWITNLHIPLSGEKAVLYRFELIRNYFWPQEDVVPDSVMLVDVTYDQMQVSISDEYGIPIGETNITDRNKLLQFLKELERRGDYRYIMLDVFFGQGTKTDVDSVLFATIRMMPRIIIPCHSGEALADSLLQPKAGLADYTTTYSESGFVKFPYLLDGQLSMPLKMYREMTGRTIRHFGLFYFDGWKLVRKSIMLTMDLTATSAYNEEGEKNWCYLGADLLGTDKDGMIYESPEITKDKYIVIGSFHGKDSHSTYLGSMAGAVINMNAYLSLLQGHHVLSLTLIIILFCAFFSLSYLTLSRQNLHEFTNGLTNIKNQKIQIFIRLSSALCSWIGYSLFLTILCIITYLTLGEAYDIFITSTMFYLLSVFIKYNDKIKNFIVSWRRK